MPIVLAFDVANLSPQTAKVFPLNFNSQVTGSNQLQLLLWGDDLQSVPVEPLLGGPAAWRSRRLVESLLCVTTAWWNRCLVSHEAPQPEGDR